MQTIKIMAANTTSGRKQRYDYVLSNCQLGQQLTPLDVADQSLPNGIVFDSRVFTPLSALAPVQTDDSNASQMQHMAVIKAFNLQSDMWDK